MVEKVLGFYKKDATKSGNRFGYWYEVYEKNLVSVRLASESVSVEWLEKYCKKNGKNVVSNFGVYVCIPKEDLLEAVRLQAEKEAKKISCGDVGENPHPRSKEKEAKKK